MKTLKDEIIKNGGHILAETANSFEYSLDLSAKLTYLVEVDEKSATFQTSQIANGFKGEPWTNWLPIAQPKNKPTRGGQTTGEKEGKP